MPIGPGTRLGPYEITALIGEGGMGKVWRAHHTGLKRDDALKVLPDAFASDPDRLARFRREAQVLASLNHPNIAHVYDLEQADGVQALVMELVEGPTLADRIAQGPIPIDEALPIAKQIAEALEAAHEQGIIHRDLKPANIKVRSDGTVKVLDFGLAKALEPTTGTGMDATASPTITSPAMMTGVGVLLGTAAYMSPEQARGKAVDKRTDIWAFGCVLYEMLTGKRAFEGEDVAETMAAILTREPDWSRLPANLPSAILRLLRRAIAKSSRDRLSDINDARLEITEASAMANELRQTGDIEISRRRRIIPIAIASSLAAVVGAGLAIAIARPSSSGSLGITRFRIDPPSGVVLNTGADESLAISRDGRQIVYAGSSEGISRVYVRLLDQIDSAPIRGSEGLGTNLFLSPDGRWVGIVGGGSIRKVPLTGGASATICDACAAETATWGPDGTMIFPGRSGGLLAVSESGGIPTPVTMPTQEVHREPHVLPDGKTLLFVIRRAGERDQIAALRPATGEQRVLLDGKKPRYAAGHLFFSREATLWAVPFNPDTLQVTRDPIRIVDTIQRGGGGAGSGFYDVAVDGSVVYMTAIASRRTLVWVDRNGNEEPIPAPARAYTIPRLSPDNTRLALEVEDQDRDVWVWDLTRQVFTRFTADVAADRMPAWTPDGTRLVFASNRSGTHNLYSQPADGSGPIVRITEGAAETTQPSVSSDGRYVIVGLNPPDTRNRSIGVIDLRTPHTEASDVREARALVDTGFTERNGELSPDGRWLAYESDESGQFEVYVRPFPAVTDGRWQASTGGGRKATWARSGRELFYLSSEGTMMVVPVYSGASFRVGIPKKLFHGSFFPPIGAIVLNERSYDVSADGQRFLMIKDAPLDAPGLVVVQHRFEEPTN